MVDLFSRIGPTATRRGARRGYTMIVVLVAMMIVTALAATWAQQAVGTHRSLEMRARQVQASWLAASGASRAAARLAADRSYVGETWRISAEELEGKDPAIVVIRVEQPGPPSQRTVEVVADYPDDEIHRVRERRHVVVELADGETN